MRTEPTGFLRVAGIESFLAFERLQKRRERRGIVSGVRCEALPVVICLEFLSAAVGRQGADAHCGEWSTHHATYRSADETPHEAPRQNEKTDARSTGLALRMVPSSDVNHFMGNHVREFVLGVDESEESP